MTIEIGKYIEKAVEWLSINASGFFDGISAGIDAIVVTGWKPHHMWADFDLKYLEDPKEVYPTNVCAIVTRLGFEEDFPVLSQFFKNFNLSEEKLYRLMEDVENSYNSLKGARTWYKNNKAFVEAWMPDEMKQGVLIRKQSHPNSNKFSFFNPFLPFFLKLEC